MRVSSDLDLLFPGVPSTRTLEAASRAFLTENSFVTWCYWTNTWKNYCHFSSFLRQVFVCTPGSSRTLWDLLVACTWRSHHPKINKHFVVVVLLLQHEKNMQRVFSQYVNFVVAFWVSQRTSMYNCGFFTKGSVVIVCEKHVRKAVITQAFFLDISHDDLVIHSITHMYCQLNLTPSTQINPQKGPSIHFGMAMAWQHLQIFNVCGMWILGWEIYASLLRHGHYQIFT